MRKILNRIFTIILNKICRVFGYSIVKRNSRYIDAKETVKKAKKAGLSICKYLESQEDDQGKAGRRDRIINRIKAIGVFDNCINICEIGTGTGMYLEKVIEFARPKRYEIYEIADDWVEYLRKTYAKKGALELVFHNADGVSLKETLKNSCDLVHAHGVFVYLPLVQTFKYLHECARVCKEGGFIIFDCYLDKSFDYETIKKWINGKWQFAVILPEKSILDFAKENSLCLINHFTEIHASSFVDYFIFKKIKN